MRPIRVHFDDGDYLETNINGTNQEILRHYVGQTFEKHDETTHYATRVVFLDEISNGLDVDKLLKSTVFDIARNLGLQNDLEKAKERISGMTPEEALDKFLNWHGIIGWTDSIVNTFQKLRAARVHRS